MSAINGRRVVLGVTGGIAAYKAVTLCRLLSDAGAHVVPVLTNGAQRMVGTATFSALASEPAKTSLWNDAETPIPHTALGQSADVIVVCPATARLISDLRTGRSGDLLTATLLATRAPIVLAPAMHTEMWEQPSVQENLAKLANRGVNIVWPTEGRLAGGDMGFGRLADPGVVMAAVEEALTPPDLAARRVLVTAGGTREPIDAVRYIGNRSSGKQGCAVAAEAMSRGAETVLVATQAAQRHAPPGVRVITADTSDEMEAAVKIEASTADMVVMAAAVADFRPVQPTGVKFKKRHGIPPVELEHTTDILAALGAAKKPGQVLVGFAAETEDLEANARRKLVSKNLDVIVANDVSKEHVGFGYDTNEVVMFTADGERHHVPLTTKRSAARAVINTAVALLETAEELM